MNKKSTLCRPELCTELVSVLFQGLSFKEIPKQACPGDRPGFGMTNYNNNFSGGSISNFFIKIKNAQGFRRHERK